MKKSYLILTALSAALAACNKGEGNKPLPPAVDPTVTPAAITLSPEEKLCMDTALSKVVDEITEQTIPEASKREEAQSQAAKDALEPAFQSCSLIQEKRDLYLKGTNIEAGMLPDSVESTSLRAGDELVSTTNGRVGKAKKVFADGTVAVYWYASGVSDSVEQASNLSKRVERRDGLYTGKELVAIDNKVRGHAIKVFANGSAYTYWNLSGMENSVKARNLLSAEVASIDGINKGVEVIRKTSKTLGKALQVYANGFVYVYWYPTGMENSVVPSTDLSPSIGE